MPKKRPEFFAGGYYHIYNRGCNKSSIFREPENYYFLLRRIKEYLPKLQLSLQAYCLMPNHYHFLVRQDGDTPARLLPQRVFNSYSKAYNKRYQHSGTLFEGPYKVKPVTESSHLIHLCRYIHANPVKDCFVDDPLDWPYSNYADWVGKRKGELVDREFISQNFGSPLEYECFVMDYLRYRKLPARVVKFIKMLEG